MIRARVIIGIDVPGKYLGGYAVIEAKTGRLLDTGMIDFRSLRAEQDEYRHLWNVLSSITRPYIPVAVAIEHAFLYLIASWIGAIKMWLANRPVPISWYMIGSGHARKVVLGTGKASKDDVLSWAIMTTGQPLLTQHQADAFLYARTYWEEQRRQAQGKKIGHIQSVLV